MTNVPYFHSIGAVSGLIKATGGSLKSFKASNRNAAVRFLQLFDQSTAPDNGATPVDQFVVPATTGMIVIGQELFTTLGISFVQGISWGFSTTSATFTAGTAADHDFAAYWI